MTRKGLLTLKWKGNLTQKENNRITANEGYKEMSSEKYLKYKDKIKAYYQAHKTEINANRKRATPELNKEYKKRYELKLKRLGFDGANDIKRFGGNRLKALKRDSFKCVLCGMSNEEHKIKYGRSITVDHIDGNGRYSKTKNNAVSNLQTLCLPCHGAKDIKRKGLRQ